MCTSEEKHTELWVVVDIFVLGKGQWLAKLRIFAVADPGFPIGGRGPRRGAVYPRGSYVSKILHVKMKESGPVGGRAPGAPPLDPPCFVFNSQHLVTGGFQIFDNALKIRSACNGQREFEQKSKHIHVINR